MVNVIEIEGMKDLIEAVGGGGGSDVPEPTSADRGKFLGVSTNSNDLEYREVKELPTSTSGDEGKVLTVDSNGDAAWATSSGGGASVYGSSNTYMQTVSSYDSQTGLSYYAYGSSVISNDGKTMAQATAGDMVWCGDSNGSRMLYIIEEYIENYSFYGPAFKLKLINSTLQHIVQIDIPSPPEVFTSTTKDISASTTADLITAIEALSFSGVTRVDYKTYSVLLYLKDGSNIDFSIDITGYTCNHKDSNSSRKLYITDSTAFTNYITAVLNRASDTTTGKTYTVSSIKSLIFTYNR